ncbi:response regulator [Magnetococcales bacterium HHB-1]
MSKERILVVDDAPSVRFIVREALAPFKLEIVEAGNGAEALRRFQEGVEAGKAFRMVITDLNMPVMDGLAFIRALREEDRKVPILMLTTESSKDKVKEGKKSGANGWAVKPVDLDPFLKAVRRLARL